MATKPQDAPICPGSAIYPDIINDPLVGQPTYVCAACGASVPNFEPAPVHRHALASF